MTTTVPPIQAPSRLRSRLALVAMGLMTLAVNVYFMVTAQGAARAMEQRALAGDFPSVHVQAGPAVITDDGRVYLAADTDPSGYVASTNLLHAGKFQQLLVADDGNEAHKKKGALVIGARDPQGAWHPASAEAIARRLAAKK